MNHGSGDTILTLLRVDGGGLGEVAAIPIEIERPDLSCKGTLSMLPRGREPADLRVTWNVTSLDDEATGTALGAETLALHWSGNAYAPDVKESTRIKTCIPR